MVFRNRISEATQSLIMPILPLSSKNSRHSVTEGIFGRGDAGCHAFLQSLETSNRQNKKYNVANYAMLRGHSWAITRVLESGGKICMRIYLPGGSRNDAKYHLCLCNNEKKAHSRLLGLYQSVTQKLLEVRVFVTLCSSLIDALTG